MLISLQTYIMVSNRFEPTGIGHSQFKHALDVPDRGVARLNVAWCCKGTALEKRLKLCVVRAERFLADGVCVLSPLVYIRLGCPICWTTTATSPT